MPPPLLDALALASLAALLAVAFAHPPEWLEATVGAGAALLLLAVGAVPVDVAADQLAALLPVVAFLCAILVVAALCAAEGLFAALGAMVTRAARDRPRRILGLTFVTASLVTATLSLDATVVLLTPVMIAAAATSLVEPRPATFACARLANSASLLLPVSNLTNLLALPFLALSFHEFVILMAPVWLVVLLVEYAGHRWFFRMELALPPLPLPPPPPRPIPVVPVVVVTSMLVGFAVGSLLGVAPAWVAASAAVVLTVHAVARGTVSPRQVVHATHASFAVFVLGLGVVVAALADGLLADVVRRALPAGDGLVALLVIALLATVTANVLNNLPATLLLVPLVAPLGDVAVLAALIGLNVGSGLTYPGSLANLLWRRTVTRQGARPSGREFHRLSFLVTPPAVVAAVLTLAAWSGVLG